MADDFVLRSMTKFDGSNFLQWKFQVKNALVALGINDVVNGTRVCVQEPAAQREKWIKDDARAMYYISTTLVPGQLDCLITCTSSKEMWDKLVAVNEQTSESNKIILLQKFYDYKMNPNDSVNQHVARLQNMIGQLKNVGEEVSDASLMAKILGSLPSKFNNLITAWDSVPMDKQNVQTLQERLLKEEGRITQSDEATNALAAMTLERRRNVSQDAFKRKKKNKRSLENVVCYECKQKGHIKPNCPNKNKYKADEGKSSSNSKACAFIANTDCRERKETSIGKEETGLPSQSQIDYLLSMEIRDVWITDSGASRHITFRKEWLTDFRSVQGQTVHLGDDGSLEVNGIGTALIKRLINGIWEDGRIEEVLYVPSLKKNLFSVGVCDVKNFELRFKKGSVTIFNKDTIAARGIKQENNIYRMFIQPSIMPEVNISESDIKIWHERLGHVNRRTVKKMAEQGLIQHVKVPNDNFFCEACEFGKSHSKPYAKIEERRETKPGEFFHSDVCGPMSETSIGGARFFLTFIDNSSDFRKVYFLKHKSDVYEKFKEFERVVANKFGQVMKTLRVDNGREYINMNMKQYLIKRGIQLEHTAPDTPQQNGKAERENRTIVESARSMIYATELPKYLWAEAVNTAVYALNRTPSSRTPEKTPYEVWNGRKPYVSHMRIFGSDAYMNVVKHKRTKFDKKAKKLILVGYQEESTNYRLYDQQTRQVLQSRNVVFYEKGRRDHNVVDQSDSDDDSAIFKFINYQSDQIIPEVEDEQVAETNDSNISVENKGPAVESTSNTRAESEESTKELLDFELQEDGRQLRDRSNIKQPSRYCVNIVEYNEPVTYQEAVTGPNADQWKTAIAEELDAHKKNMTWELVPNDIDRDVIDSKWVFKVIRKSSGEVHRFKARLCARGFLQKPGRDYTETFSPVVRYDSLKVLLAITAEEDLELVQFDVKTAFLYGELSEEVFMKVPEGLIINSDQDQMVCRLIKALYGLKQASRCWNEKFKTFLKRFDFKQSNADECIFVGMVENETVYLAVYVDDGLMAAKSMRVLNVIVNALKQCFDVTIGDAKVYIGLQIERNRESKQIFLHQHAYVLKVIERFGQSDAHPVAVPADPNVTLKPAEQGTPKIIVPYREAVGSLLFLSTVTRPDIAYAVYSVSRFMNAYTKDHWEAVKRIIRYLKGTACAGIRFGKEKHEVKCYADADFANDLMTRRSVSGYVLQLAGGPVTWSSHRQGLVTLSTTEAEYVAASTAAREIIWLRLLLSDMKHECNDSSVMFVDNQSAIKLSKNAEFHKRSKHIAVKYHFLREKIKNGDINIVYIPTKEQIADVLTKALPCHQFYNFCHSMGMDKISNVSDGGSVRVKSSR